MIIVNPNNRVSGKFSAIEAPIWCAYLANNGDEIWDLQVKDSVDLIRTGEEALIVVMGANPSASSTPKMVGARIVEEELKRLNITSRVAGLHPTATGEASYPIPSPQELTKIKPRWDLVDFSKYKAHNWHCFHDLDSRGNYGVVYSSFGCPFNCYFCNIKALYKGITFRKPKDVVDEIGYLVSRSVKNLKFCDELFALNEAHVTEICEGISNYNLNIWAYARADTITPKLLKTMKGAGFNWLAYGFEGKDKGDQLQAVKMTRDAGINVMGNFMFGLPDETMDDMKRSFASALNLHCEYINFYVALPYPGSKWYADLKDKPTDWSSFNQYSENICADPEVIKFRDRAYRAYITNPEYLSMIKGKFGDRAVQELRDMAEWRFR